MLKVIQSHLKPKQLQVLYKARPVQVRPHANACMLEAQVHTHQHTLTCSDYGQCHLVSHKYNNTDA